MEYISLNIRPIVFISEARSAAHVQYESSSLFIRQSFFQLCARARDVDERNFQRSYT